MDPLLTPVEINTWQPAVMPVPGITALEAAHARVTAAGHWAPWQALGRRFAIGCVALEITQRCNLDCTFCYLSEASQALHDIPLEEVLRRVDLIRAHYGTGTDVQITGGEPTLRRPDELEVIVRHVAQQGLRPSLLTNGIKASRGLLARLSRAGLVDVAFHVDTTQARAGDTSESALNPVRQEYIARARGLPLAVFFNTTVHAGNIAEIPALVRFFKAEAAVVRLCSFQLGAATGRSIGDTRRVPTAAELSAAIEEGVGTQLNFAAAGCGPAACNRYAYALLVGQRAVDLFADDGFVQRMLEATRRVYFDRTSQRQALLSAVRFLLMHPAHLGAVGKRALKLGWQLRRDLLAARGKVQKLSFFIHRFMPPDALERSRVEACSFMVMTPQGPLSMCLHNAKRDDYLLVHAQVSAGAAIKFWDPTSGRLTSSRIDEVKVQLTRRTARGSARLKCAAAAAEPQPQVKTR